MEKQFAEKKPVRFEKYLIGGGLSTALGVFGILTFLFTLTISALLVYETPDRTIRIYAFLISVSGFILMLILLGLSRIIDQNIYIIHKLREKQ